MIKNGYVYARFFYDPVKYGKADEPEHAKVADYRMVRLEPEQEIWDNEVDETVLTCSYKGKSFTVVRKELMLPKAHWDLFRVQHTLLYKEEE